MKKNILNKIALATDAVSKEFQSIILEALDAAKDLPLEDRIAIRYSIVQALGENLGIMLSHSFDFGLDSEVVESVTQDSLERGKSLYTEESLKKKNVSEPEFINKLN